MGKEMKNVTKLLTDTCPVKQKQRKVGHTGWNRSVDVGRAVQRIENHHISRVCSFNEQRLVLLFHSKRSRCPDGDHGNEGKVSRVEVAGIMQQSYQRATDPNIISYDTLSQSGHI